MKLRYEDIREVTVHCGGFLPGLGMIGVETERERVGISISSREFPRVMRYLLQRGFTLSARQRLGLSLILTGNAWRLRKDNIAVLEDALGMTVDKKDFWEKKILGWEDSRYAAAPDRMSLLERIARRSSDSLRFRLDIAADLLRPHLGGKVLLDVGCGSGLLFQRLLDAGAKHFIGIDLAESAIVKARELAEEHGYANRTTFLAGNLDDMDLPECDVVVGLGLLDWLTDEEIDLLFGKVEGTRVLFSISERRRSPSQFLHRLYVHLSYGRKTGAYVPAYHDTTVMTAMLERHGFTGVQVVRDRRLSFGALLHNLPGTPPERP